MHYKRHFSVVKKKKYLNYFEIIDYFNIFNSTGNRDVLSKTTHINICAYITYFCNFMQKQKVKYLL